MIRSRASSFSLLPYLGADTDNVEQAAYLAASEVFKRLVVDRKYKAFISYSHNDEKWAAWLHRALEAFRPPKDLADAGRLRPVFRDRSELGAGELSPAIEAALAASETLIVICSPSAAASDWVAAEIQKFKATHAEPQILPIVVDGGAGGAYDSVFPEPLKSDGSAAAVELLAADARKGKDGRANALLKLAAPMLGVTYDALKRREDSARMRRLLGVSVGAVAVAAGAVLLSVVAFVARQEAEARRQQAENLVTFMIGDFRDELGRIGRLELMEAVGNEALAYFESLDEEDLTPDALLQRGRAVRQIADVEADRGQLESALELYDSARDTMDRARAGAGASLAEPLTFERAKAWEASSEVHYVRGDADASRTHGERYRGLVEQLVKDHPENPAYRYELATADHNLGALAFAHSALPESEARFTSALASVQALLAESPEDIDAIALSAGVGLWLGDLAERRGDLQAARQFRETALERERVVSRLDPTPANSEALARALTISSVSNRDDAPQRSLEQAREAVALLRELAAFEPDNATWQQRLSRAITIAVGSELALGCGAEVPVLLAEARQLADALISEDPGRLESQRDRIDADVLGARYALGVGDPGAAETLARTAYDRALAVLGQNPRDDVSKRYLLRAARERIRSSQQRGRDGDARSAAQAVLEAVGALEITDPAAAELRAVLEEVAAGGPGDWSAGASSRCDA